MKQVFLIGDSIREGYCEKVKEALRDRAEVIYPGENCRTSQYIVILPVNDPTRGYGIFIENMLSAAQ